jgi:copper transport protein
MTVRPRRSLALALAVAAVLGAPAAARAHAVLTRAEPADGARLGASPQRLRLWFDEDVSPRFRSAQLLDPRGRPVPGVRLEQAAGPASTLVVRVPALRRGVYALAWHVLSEDDGHPTSGVVQFGVRTAAAPVGRATSATDAAPAAVDVVLRWARFALLAVLIGGLVFVAGVLPSARPWVDPELVGRVRGRVLRAGVWAAGLALAVQVAALVRQVGLVSAARPGASWPAQVRELLTSSRWGTLWLGATALLAVLAAAVARMRRSSEFMPFGAAAVAGVVVVELVAVEALGSHSAAVRRSGLPTAAEALHLLAAAAWTGLLISLVLACLPVQGATRRETTALIVAIRRPFAWAAGPAAVTLVVTGLYAAGVQVESVDGLLLTLYGRTLLVKVGAVALVGCLGAINFLLLRRLALGGRAAVARLTIALEASLAVAVLVAAGILTAAAPARGPAFASPRPIVPATVARQASDLVLTATIRPNRPGANVVRVVAASALRPPPASIGAIAVDPGIPGATATPLHALAGEQGWFGTIRLDRSGDARLTVVVQRGGRFLSAPFRWRVEPADPARAVTVSSRRLAPLLDRAALLIVLFLAVGCALVLALRSFHVPRGPLARVRFPRAEGSR